MSTLAIIGMVTAGVPAYSFLIGVTSTMVSKQEWAEGDLGAVVSTSLFWPLVLPALLGVAAVNKLTATKGAGVPRAKVHERPRRTRSP